MTDSNPFSCYLIGSDTLLAQCGDMLLERNHAIRGVITSSAAIRSWASRHGIEVHDADSDYAGVVASDTFDFLFAITHLELIPEAAISAPGRMAVNFHDGPLPAYAGLNTPMWALLNGEQDYAITWHSVAAGIDTGDILLQQPVAIGSDDTALSLNTKCFAAALESFPVLIEQLASGTEQPKAQDLDSRTYFGRNDKPDVAGVIDWRKPAQVSERLVRALNTGSYANPLAVAKLLLDDAVVLVDSADLADSVPGASPGQIIVADSDRLVVATADGALAVTAVRKLDGRALKLSELLDRSEVGIGTVLPSLDDSLTSDLGDLARKQSRLEASLVPGLASIEPLNWPYRDAATAAKAESEAVVVPVPESFLTRANEADSPARLIAGAFAQFVSRVTSQEKFVIPVAAADLKRSVQLFDLLFASYSIAEFNMSADASAWSQAAACLEACESSIARGPWLRDLVARDPALHANGALSSNGALPVVIVFGDYQSSELSRAELVLRIGSDGTATLESGGAYSGEGLSRLAQHFSALLESMAASTQIKYSELDLISEAERARLLKDWNQTDLEYGRLQTISGAFAEQLAKTPSSVAVVCRGSSVSYEELDQRASAIAGKLQELGIKPNALVGVHVPRSIDLVTATLGVLKSGGAYVPLDPAFPKDRLEYMIEDSAMDVIVSHSSISGELSSAKAEIIEIDSLDIAGSTPAPAESGVSSSDLAYVIYTSGSTGRPKGVMIEHRNAINFFAGMDRAIPYDPNAPGTWLAVTSLSFDISVLELLWTLTRGFKVVVHDEALTKSGGEDAPASMSSRLGLGLFMWGNDDAAGPAKYRLLMEGSKYFDANGFHAVWTPERHFHAFGGPYPNPAVTGAAVAAVTENLKIRAGSCVVPLHHPVRIAEEWSVVDNLSNGRVEIAAASGWNPNDFVLQPENHADNKNVMLRNIEQIRKLWRGETLSFPGPLGDDVEVQSLPRPVQAELPVWVTTAGNPETWRAAGRGGFHVLTHLLGQTVAEVGEKIRIYREARAEAGFDPDSGQVALMLHTFVGDDDDEVKEIVRAPMKSYLSSSMRLAMNFAWSFPAFKRPGGQDTRPEDVDIKSLSDEEVDTILDFAFDRYFSTSGLFGTVDTCLDMLRRCSAIGVTEIACLFDFGVDTDLIMGSLPLLKSLREKADADVSAGDEAATGDYSFAGMVTAHKPTHMQCTPSMARMYLTTPESASALKSIPHIMLGGEALPVELARSVNAGRSGTLTNMYGPTETTIWSATESIEAVDDITIGRPIANTQCYVLDKMRRPVPVGVAGELYIAGDGVARGYLNRPELTAERFVSNPFADNDGQRMYATGDLASYRDDGRLEYIGRADFQVKIRGYRIELGEIEALLEGRENVAEAAVIVRSEDASDLRLVGFVVAAAGAAVDGSEMRTQLRDKLPDYMVPAEIFVLPEMPRTANGKLDRKTLMSMRTEVARVVTEDAIPQEGIQKEIASHWQQVLKLDEVGVDENFFDLGGHSLLVVQLHNRLKESLSAPLSLTDLYQYPTIRSLSDYLGSGGKSETLKKGASRGARRRALRSRSA